MIRDVVVTDGVRTPFCKAGTALAGLTARELGRIAVRELIERADLDPARVDHVVLGNIAGPADATNLARIVALDAGLPERVPAVTVNRNCASGMESIAAAARLILAREAEVVIAGGVESMSQVPLLFPAAAKEVLGRIGRARSRWEQARGLAALRPHHLTPVVALRVGLTDPVSGLSMGETAEVIAKRFRISREQQDAFALRSHQRAVAARAWLADEIVPVFPRDHAVGPVATDVGPRDHQSAEALAALEPVFDRRW
ncbi:MAG: thiolase family protein, partial [Candidatus Eiseniibacteriota bacterium]